MIYISREGLELQATADPRRLADQLERHFAEVADLEDVDPLDIRDEFLARWRPARKEDLQYMVHHPQGWQGGEETAEILAEARRLLAAEDAAA